MKGGAPSGWINRLIAFEDRGEFLARATLDIEEERDDADAFG